MKRLKNILGPFSCFLFGLGVYMLVMPFAVFEKHQQDNLFTLPPKMIRVVTFQFKEVAADISFLNALVFIGGTRTQTETQKYLPEQYAWIFNTLNNSAALDPYFLDPYLLMNSGLIWDDYKVSEVNSIIASGADSRKWDHLLAYYAGFNYYYFLNDYDASLRYLREASKRTNGNTFYDSLATKIAYKANKTELAIIYVEHQIVQYEMEGYNQSSIDALKNRLELLKQIRKVELAVESYRNLFGRLPNDMDQLYSSNLLMPTDGKKNIFKIYIDDKGRVRSKYL